MTTLVLTLVGHDRAGLVAEVARIVDVHEGNWENSELAELAGAFAGIVEVSVPAHRADALRSAVAGTDGLLTVAVEAPAASASAPSPSSSAPSRRVELTVLGNDHAGIVREITSALSAHGLSIERMSTESRDAAMSGGRLFEASIVASVPHGAVLADVQGELERLAAEIQVDVALAD